MRSLTKKTEMEAITTVELGKRSKGCQLQKTKTQQRESSNQEL